MLTQQQKNIKKMLTDLRLKYDVTIAGSVYIHKNKKIKSIQDILFYLLKYGIVETGKYTKIREYILVYNEGIGCISYNNQTGRTKIELYKVEN